MWRNAIWNTRTQETKYSRIREENFAADCADDTDFGAGVYKKGLRGIIYMFVGLHQGLEQ
jgi:hypothetical protein